MRTKRTFRPTGDCLESRDVPASFGLASRIAQIPHANMASRLNTPFVGTLRLGTANIGRQLTSNRTTAAGAFNNGLALNQLAASLRANQGTNVTVNQLRAFIAANLGTTVGTNLTTSQLTTLLNRLNAGSLIGNNPALTNAILTNLTATLRANATNPNFASLLGTTPTGSLLNNGVNFPATLSSQSLGAGTGFGLNGLFGSPFANTGLNGLFGSPFTNTGLNGLFGSPFGNTSLLGTGMGFGGFI